MASKKPWRTLVIDDREVVGRFTRKQIEEAVLKEERERRPPRRLRVSERLQTRCYLQAS